MKSLKKDSVYLGAPLFMSKTPTKDFKYLQDRLETRLRGWRSKSLSQAGRCTLIFLTYSMTTFDIPIKSCDNLDALTN